MRRTAAGPVPAGWPASGSGPAGPAGSPVGRAGAAGWVVVAAAVGDGGPPTTWTAAVPVRAIVKLTCRDRSAPEARAAGVTRRTCVTAFPRLAIGHAHRQPAEERS